MFRAVFQGPHGSTVEVPDPKLAAYKQAAYIQNVLGRNYCLTGQADGTVTIAGDGLEPITYQPE